MWQCAPDDAAIHTVDVTHVAELRRILADGDWHSTAEILRRHPMMVHSRVSDLRRAGLMVEHRTVGQGAAGSEYRIALGEPSSAANGGSPSATHDGARPGYEGGSRSPDRQAEPHARRGVAKDGLPLSLSSDLPAHSGQASRVESAPESRPEISDLPRSRSGRPPEPADGWGANDSQVEEAAPYRLPGQLTITEDV